MKRLILFSLLIIPALLGAERLPVEYFFRNPEFSQPKLSPDGTHLAVLLPFQGVKNVAVFDLNDRQPKILTGESVDVTRIAWANNDHILYWKDAPTTDNERMRYYGGVYVVDKEGKRARALVPPASSRRSFGGRAALEVSGSVQVIDSYAQDSEKVMVLNNSRHAKFPDVYLMDIESGRMARYLKNTEGFNYFQTDLGGEVRFAWKSFDEHDGQINRSELWFRDPKTEEWRLMDSAGPMESLWSPVAYEPDIGKTYIISNDGRDKQAIFLWNAETGNLSDEPVLADDVYSLNERVEPFIGLRSDRLVGVSYHREKPVHHYFDEQHKKLQGLIDSALPTTFNRVVSADEAGKILMIESYSDVQPPVYYLLRLKGMAMEKLLESMQWVEPAQLCERMPISYEASDGRTIHGYLTLPKSYKEGNPVPLIVNPHGGPWARDGWGIRWYYDMEPQFFANRGFAVLQVNFRGSTGYGSDHLESSYKNVHRMHLDWLDGVKWAIEKGYADENNIGICGASWGGYSTMYGLTKFPEVFKFGINMMGVVDVVEQINTYRTWDRERAYDYWIRRIGDPSDPKERAQLEEWSPINFVENIKAPVFVYHGVRDMNVDIEQARMLIGKLKGEDKKFESLIRTDETHTSYEEEERIELYKEIDKFIAPFAPKAEE